jgi:hypothetical protein
MNDELRFQAMTGDHFCDWTDQLLVPAMNAA